MKITTSSGREMYEMKPTVSTVERTSDGKVFVSKEFTYNNKAREIQNMQSLRHPNIVKYIDRYD